MSQNITIISSQEIIGLNIVVIGYSLSTVISTIICLIIITITYITPNLHSSTYLLISNTCIHSLFFSIVAAINIFFFYFEQSSSDWLCRIRGYFSYVSICVVVYSYAIQTISRLFYTIFYRYRYLLSIKCHLYLIFFQISLSFLFPLSCLLTEDIIFRPFKLCLISARNKLHTFYIICVVYIIPVLIIVILYIIIYRHIKNSSLNTRRSPRIIKRNAELARNILILSGIFLFGGVPTSIYVILASTTISIPTAFYIIALLTPGISVCIEKIATIFLTKEIRKIVKQQWIVCYSMCLSSPTHVEQFALPEMPNNRIYQATNKVGPITMT